MVYFTVLLVAMLGQLYFAYNIHGKKENKMKNQTKYDIDCVFDGLDSIGAIYISNYTSAALKQIRTKFNIKAVVSIASSGYLQQHHQLIDYLYIPAQDSHAYQMHTHFQQTYQFIDKHRKEGNVLVHCMVGKSRSATIVAAYLLRKYRYSLSMTMTMLRRKRNIIDPNPGFMKQLESYCQELGVSKGDDWKSKSGCKPSLRDRQFGARKSLSINQQNKSISTVQPEHENQKLKVDINQKILKLREQLIHVGKLKTKKDNKKLYSGLQVFSQSASTSLPSNATGIVWKQNKSLQLD